MKFILNNKPCEIHDLDPNMTLLRFLRTKARLAGTKEGCASGDCGACTVLVKDENASWYSVNSCITLLGQIVGKSVLTTEGLGSADNLHPVQQAMVDCHGSQCGFCTPGFVMSLAGLYQKALNSNSSELSKDEVGDAISGNLCRCTGYKPILEAGKSMLDYPEKPIAEKPITKKTGAIDVAHGLNPVMSYGSRQLYQPTTEDKLQTLLKNYPSAILVAGGTDIILEISQRYQRFDTIISVSEVDELKKLTLDDKYLIIGAGASYSAIESLVAPLSTPFYQLLHRLGSRQIRNRGTLGGNIANASPIADTPPILIAWQAEVEIVSNTGERTWTPITDYYLDYKRTILNQGQYLAAIRIPCANIKLPHRFFKLSKRFEDDISAAMLAVSVELDNDLIKTIRIALGGVAAVPFKALKTEASLTGQTINDESLKTACEILATEISPLSDVRASAKYRLAMTGNLLKKALIEIRDNTSIEVFHYPEVNVEGQLHA